MPILVFDTGLIETPLFARLGSHCLFVAVRLAWNAATRLDFMIRLLNQRKTDTSNYYLLGMLHGLVITFPLSGDLSSGLRADRPAVSIPGDS